MLIELPPLGARHTSLLAAAFGTIVANGNMRNHAAFIIASSYADTRADFAYGQLFLFAAAVSIAS